MVVRRLICRLTGHDWVVWWGWDHVMVRRRCYRCGLDERPFK